MKTPRHLTLAILFLGLIALEITHGAYRIRSIREREQRALLETVARGHREVYGELRRRLGEEREHAAYLAKLPWLRALLESSAGLPAQRSALETELLPYVVSFRGIDSVRVLDATGRERFRCERIGNGVGSIPEALLEPEPNFGLLGWLRETSSGKVSVSGLVHDSRRVEVPERDRQVLHFGTSVEGARGRIGYLVLTAYAAPILQQVRSYSPYTDVSTSLVEADGSYLAHPDRSKEKGRPTAANILRELQGLSALPSPTEEGLELPEGVLFAQPAGDPEPSWTLLTFVPRTTLSKAAEAWAGEYFWVAAGMAVISGVLLIAGVLLVRMSIREVELRESERYRKQEEELNRRMQLSERLGSLGLLTAGVAHEINNPLEGIENYLALLEREQASPEKRKRYVEMIRYGFHRIRDIVRDLSAFARPGLGTGTADIAACLTQALKMVGYTKEFKQVAVEFRGLDSPIHVAGDCRRLEQVFLNLFLNAAKAMGGQGSILISAKLLEATQGREEVELTIEDTGPGIPVENLGRIFDPFFTTSDGTGLGLSISYGIIQAHGGTLSASNRAEGGARFTLRLPVTIPVATMARSESARNERSET